MNERKLKQLNVLVLLTIFAGIIFIGIFVFVFAPKNNNYINFGKLKLLNDNWILRSHNGNTDELIELPNKIDAEAEQTIVIAHKIPEDVSDDTVLLIETQFQNILVTIGEESVYSNGVLSNQKLMKSAVPCYNVIDIGDAEPGDIVTVYLASAYKKYSGEIGSVYYGTRGDVVSQIIKDNGLSFVFSITMFIITILLMISLVFMKNVNVDKRKSAYAFAFILVMTLWSITGNPIMQLLTSNNFGVYMSNMVLILILPVLYIMHQRCFAVKRRYAKIFEIGIYIFAINFITGVIFQLFGVVDFASYMIFSKGLIVLGLILLSAIMYLAADVYSDKTIYSNFWANLVLTVASIVEAVLSVFSFYIKYDGMVLQIGVFLFMILLLISVEKSLIMEMNQQKEDAINTMEIEKNRAVKNINTALIYNSFNKVINTVKSKDIESSRLVYDTSIYMKYNMQAVNDKNMVPFSEELEYIKSYIGIQSKLNEQLDISIEDKVIDFKVPFNTIEPIVENAIINGALKAENGRFVFRSYERLDCFAIQIVDNGPGIGPDKVFEGKQSFKNIKKRLKTMCAATVEVRNKPDKGTIITVKIPKDGYIMKE